MAKVTINGKEYGLRFDLYAMEQIEEELGSIKDAFAALREGKQLKTTMIMFRVMANSYLSFNGEEETVTGNELRHIGVEEFVTVSEGIKKAVEEGSKSETTGGNEADDDVHDIFLEEIEREERKN